MLVSLRIVYQHISEWVKVICYTCEKTQSVQLFILDMWVKMQIKKTRDLQDGMVFLWEGKALGALVCLRMRMKRKETD